MRNTVIGILTIALLVFVGFALWPELVSAPQQSYDGKSLYTFIDRASGIEFQYPMLPTAYVRAQAWPPKVTIRSARQCNDISINGRSYCVTTVSEGAAGTTYTTYTYSTSKDRMPITFTFTLGFLQCMNYDEPNKTNCQRVQQSLDVNSIVDAMVQTLKFR